MTQKFTLIYTLALLAALCITFAPTVEANNMAIHARMIKKRAGFDDVVRIRAVPPPLIPIIGAGADPNEPTDDGTNASETQSATRSAEQGSPSSPPIPSAPASNPLSIGLSLPPIGGSSVSSALRTTSTTSSSSSISSSSIPSSSSSSTLPSQTPESQTSSSGSVVVATVTSSPTADQPTPSASSSGTSGAASDNGGHLTRNTIIAIVVVAACVGGAIIIWTVIRKWKFAPSDEFGDRLNPIDWRPTSSGEKDNEKFGELEGTGVGHRRRGSGGSNRSFVSADAQSQIANHRNNNYNNGSNNMIPDLPAHDFTAGTTHGGLAPVGAYADLRRGPSPIPSMGDQYYRGYGATAQYGTNGY